MKPVKFEIIGEDKTKPATDSAAQNLDALNVKIEEQKALITKLQGEINKMQSTTSFRLDRRLFAGSTVRAI